MVGSPLVPRVFRLAPRRRQPLCTRVFQRGVRAGQPCILRTPPLIPRHPSPWAPSCQRTKNKHPTAALERPTVHIDEGYPTVARGRGSPKCGLRFFLRADFLPQTFAPRICPAGDRNRDTNPWRSPCSPIPLGQRQRRKSLGKPSQVCAVMQTMLRAVPGPTVFHKKALRQRHTPRRNTQCHGRKLNARSPSNSKHPHQEPR